MTRLAVIVVSYNTRDLLRNCLASVVAAGQATADLHIETIVVDNASRDGSAAMVAAEFPQARLTALDENTGFTAANNLALAQLGFDPRPRTVTAADILRPAARAEVPDYVLLLNPDCEVARDSLAQLVAFMESEPASGACGPQLRYGSGAFQHGAFAFPGLAQIALDLLPLHALPGAARFYAGRVNGRYPAKLWAGARPFAVDFVLGAAMLVRGTTIAQIGGLDEGFFMYCEEMDWSLRMQEADWRVFAVPAAIVVHHEAQSSRQVRWPAFVQLWRSRLRFYGKHEERYPLGYLWLVRGLLRTGLRLRGARTRRAFAHGRVTGSVAGEELAAYRTVREL